jgi:hypothetical protein
MVRWSVLQYQCTNLGSNTSPFSIYQANNDNNWHLQTRFKLTRDISWIYQDGKRRKFFFLQVQTMRVKARRILICWYIAGPIHRENKYHFIPQWGPRTMKIVKILSDQVASLLQREYICHFTPQWGPGTMGILKALWTHSKAIPAWFGNFLWAWAVNASVKW